MPSGPGVIADELITEIAAGIPAGVSTFLLTSETDAEEIVAHYLRANTTAIQIVDYVDEVVYEFIRRKIPRVKLVQVIHVEDGASVERAARAAILVDALLLDSGKPRAETKILGGTGQVHDWELSKKIVAQCPKPVFLAGGINHTNVRSAIETVHPFAIDVCTGVRTNGKLDAEKVKLLFREIASADSVSRH